jgi:hypothetical protein
MEVLVVLLVGLFAGSAVTYDVVAERRDKFKDRLTICKMELSEYKEELRECNRKP